MNGRCPSPGIPNGSKFATNRPQKPSAAIRPAFARVQASRPAAGGGPIATSPTKPSIGGPRAALSGPFGAGAVIRGALDELRPLGPAEIAPRERAQAAGPRGHVVRPPQQSVPEQDRAVFVAD